MISRIGRLCFTLLVLLQVACVPSSSDPYIQRAAAEGAIEATSVARQVNAASTSRAMDAAALEATRYAGELLAAEAQIKGTQAAIGAEQTAIALQSTRAAADLQATAYRATSQIIEMQSTQAYLVEYANAMGTATAIVQNQQLELDKRADAYERAMLWKWLWLVLAVMLLVALGGVLFVAIVSWWSLRQARVKVILNQLPVSYTQPLLPARVPDDKDEVITFLTHAAQVVGGNSQQLPRWDSMPPRWHAEKWTEVTDRLQRAGVLLKIARKGSFIKEPYLCIDRLRQAIEVGEVVVPPYYPGMSTRYGSANREQNRTEGDFWLGSGEEDYD